MAAPWNPVVKGQDWEGMIMLVDYANPGDFKVNPTLAAGDVQISKDGGAFANLATLPVVEPASGRAVKVVLSTSETNCDKLIIQFVDQTAPKEWADLAIPMNTTQ